MSESLAPEIEKLVQQELATGKYGSREEVLLTALHALRETDTPSRLAALREKLRPALERLDRGEGQWVEAGKLREFFDQIVAETDAELAAQDRGE